jgi:hypothetical protein
MGHSATLRDAIVLTLFCTVLFSTNARSQDASGTGSENMVVTGNFAGPKKKEIARDLSGIACKATSAEAGLKCVVINDENNTAQLVTIVDNTLIVGPQIFILASSASDVFGKAPPIACAKGIAKSSEFDGEGVTYFKPFFYIVGSHGCSRKKDQLRLSSFQLVRLDIDDAAWRQGDREVIPYGKSQYVRTFEASYRLYDRFQRSARLRPYLGKNLQSENGLNIEGIAAVDGKLVTGLRAPSESGTAFLVISDIGDLFEPGNGASAGESEVKPIQLGDGAGIRDLASLGDAKILVLAGPAQAQESVPYSVSEVDLLGSGSVMRFKEIITSGGGSGKAEGLTVLSATDQDIRVLILFDGVSNGAPRRIRFSRK